MSGKLPDQAKSHAHSFRSRIGAARWCGCAAVVVVALCCSFAGADDRFLVSDGVRIHYAVEGAGEPVLLLHGFAANIQLQWGAYGVIKDLARDHQVIAIDLRGHGRSAKPHEADQYGMHLVDDVLRVLDELKVEQAHLVGYSLGGLVAMKMQATYPQRVISVTIGGTGWAPADDKRLLLIERVADSLDAGKGIEPLVLEYWPTDEPGPTAEQMTSINHLLALTNDQKALAAMVRGLLKLEVTEAQLRDNRIPTLSLVGDRDPMRTSADEMAKRMAHLRTSVIADTDHMTAAASPAFRREVREFIHAHPVAKKSPAPDGNRD